jgi:NTE family protein
VLAQLKVRSGGPRRHFRLGRVKVGLVFGGGGLVGLGFHAGALEALAERGVDVSGADLIVGTSAGSIVASYLACGRELPESRPLFAPVWSSHSERVRRMIGSGFAMLSSRGLWRGPQPTSFLRRTFPAGLYSTVDTRRKLAEDLSGSWPERSLYLCAVDLYTGKRVAFGAPGAPSAALPDAVMASIAIPGFFPAVRVAGRHYVDGGVVSATSVDLAAAAGCDAILCIAPLGYHNDLPLNRSWTPIILRTAFTRSLRREVLAARAAGADVLVLRPYLSDVRAWGTNFMKVRDRMVVAEVSRKGVHRMLDERADHPVLGAFTSRTARA